MGTDDRKGKRERGLHEVWRARTQDSVMRRCSVPQFPQMYTRTNETHSPWLVSELCRKHEAVPRSLLPAVHWPDTKVLWLNE